jgi:hypothetical protein
MRGARVLSSLFCEGNSRGAVIRNLVFDVAAFFVRRASPGDIPGSAASRSDKPLRSVKLQEGGGEYRSVGRPRIHLGQLQGMAEQWTDLGLKPAHCETGAGLHTPRGCCSIGSPLR